RAATGEASDRHHKHAKDTASNHQPTAGDAQSFARYARERTLKAVEELVIAGVLPPAILAALILPDGQPGQGGGTDTLPRAKGTAADGPATRDATRAGTDAKIDAAERQKITSKRIDDIQNSLLRTLPLVLDPTSKDYQKTLEE